MFLKELYKMSKIVFILATVSFNEHLYNIVTLTKNSNMKTRIGKEINV